MKLITILTRAMLSLAFALTALGSSAADTPARQESSWEVRHLQLVLGNSMGGMHIWMWAQKYPEFMDIAVPMASLPTAGHGTTGQARFWKQELAELLRTAPRVAK